MLTTAGLDDLEALAAANALAPKKYLVYLQMVSPNIMMLALCFCSSPDMDTSIQALDLPMPQSEWCRYSANPVATTLRAECPEWGVTPNMVLPILPNTAHLGVPNPFADDKDPEYIFELPFKSCYFWVESDTELRVRVRRGDGGTTTAKPSPWHCDRLVDSRGLFCCTSVA